MHIISNIIFPDVKLIKPHIFSDLRGHFFESYHINKFNEAGINTLFTQDNQSQSSKHVIRGMHFQKPPKAQAKCIRVIHGEIFDVIVDIRKSSPTFGQWSGFTLNSKNNHMLYIPEWFAHGFLVLSELAIIHYKCSNTYSPEHEVCLKFDDPTVNIGWPTTEFPKLSDKDRLGLTLDEVAL